MSLVSDWANWVDQSIIEKGKAAIGGTFEYLAPENTRRREVLDKMGTVQRAIGSGISTGLLLTDKNNPEFQDGFQLSDIGNTYRNEAQKISPTQALFAASDLPMVGLPAQVIRAGYKLAGQEAKTPTGARADFNIYDDTQRRKAFEEEILGKWATGAGDFAVTWYADPFVVGGKVGKLAKIKAISPVAPLGDIAKIDKAMSTGGVSTFIDYALKTDSAGILKHPVAQKSSDPELVAGIFGDISETVYGTEARSIAEDSLRSMLNDEQALGRLKQKAASIADIIDRSKSTNLTKSDLQYAANLNYNGDVNAMLLADKELGNKYTSIIEDLKKRSGSLNKVLRRVEDATIESPFIGGRSIIPSRFSAVEKARFAVAETKAKAFLNDTSRLKTGSLNTIDGLEWSTQTIKKSIYDHAIRVISWSGLQKPSGWLEHKGIASAGSSDELIAFMDQVGPWKTNTGAQIKRDFVNKYNSALTDADRIAIALNIENAAVKAINKAEGLDRKLTPAEISAAKAKKVPSPKTLSDLVMHELRTRRNNVVDLYREKGFAHDGGEWIMTDPVLSSQIGDAMPMLDIALYNTFAKENRNVLLNAALSVKDFSDRAYSAFDSVWRPAVLLRLGYPQRSVFEGTLRSILYHQNALEMGMALMKGTKNLVGNLYHSNISSRIEKYNIAKELGLKAPKVTLGSWKSLVKWQESELFIIRDRYKKLSDDLLNEQNIARNKDKTSAERKIAAKNVDLYKKDLKDLKQQLDKQESLFSDMLIKVSMATEKRGGKYNKLRLGQENINIDNLVFKGSAQGALGSVGMKLASSLQRTKKEIRNPLIQGSKYHSYGWSTIEPGDPNYFAALNVVARQYRETEVTNRMLRIDETLGPKHVQNELNKIKLWFISNDRIAKKEFRNTIVEMPTELNKKSAKNVDNYIVDRWNEVRNNFPDLSVRRDIVQKDAVPSAYELQARMGARNDLKPTYGEILYEKRRNAGELYNDFINTAFKWLGSMPEDILVRHPFYNSVYKSAIERGAASLQAQSKRLGRPVPQSAIASIERAAHKEALKETNRTLYTIKRYSNFAASLRFISPFVQSQLNTFRVWGRLGFENPVPFIRPTAMWQDPYNKEMVQKDPKTGEPVLTIQVPESWRKKNIAFAAITDLKFPVTRLNVPFSGEPWFSSGFGPVPQMTFSEWLKAHPDIDIDSKNSGLNLPIKRFADKYVLPNGVSKEYLSLDLVLPSTAKRLLSIARGVDDNAYLTQYGKLTAIENQKFRQGLRDTEPTPDEINSRTNWLFALRFGINATFGVVPQYGQEFQFWFDKYNEYQTKYGFDMADAKFYEEYPEFFEMVVTTFRKNTTGIEATPEAVDRADANRNLISKMIDDDPYVTQMITNGFGAERTFDQTAYVWQLNKKPGITGDVSYRNDISVIEATNNSKVKLGWAKFNSFASWLDSEREKYGYVSLNSKGAGWLKDIKKQFVADQLKENPEWHQSYTEGFQPNKYKGTLRAIDTMLSDEKFTNSDWFKKEPAYSWLIDYMDMRDYVSKGLQQSSSSDIDSAINFEYRNIVDNFVADAKRNSPKFGLWYDRFLEQDGFGVYK